VIWLRLWPYGAIGVLALLCWHLDARAVANAEMVRAQAASYRSAQAAAAVIAQQALQQEKARYAAQAQEAQNEYEHQVADAHADADNYIAAHRAPAGLRTTPVVGAPGTAPAAGSAGGADVPAVVPADTVLVSAGDVQACTNAVTYAVQAHDWAASLNP
jgi:hypothetical protein